MSGKVVSVQSENRQITFKLNDTNNTENTEIYLPNKEFNYTKNQHQDNTTIKQYLVTTSLEPQYIDNQETDLSIVFDKDGNGIKWKNDIKLETLDVNELNLEGDTVEATAEEINILHDLEVSQAEIKNLQGSKSNIQEQINNIINPTNLSQFGVTASNDEINKLDGDRAVPDNISITIDDSILMNQKNNIRQC